MTEEQAREYKTYLEQTTDIQLRLESYADEQVYRAITKRLAEVKAELDSAAIKAYLSRNEMERRQNG